jgi:hypothetical protein
MRLAAPQHAPIHLQSQPGKITSCLVISGCACRREQQATAANAALQDQMSQQQHMLQEQQQQLASMQEQLTQLKDMHKKKLVRYKAQLQQQYEAQLAAATTAYTQELSLVHVSGRTGVCCVSRLDVLQESSLKSASTPTVHTFTWSDHAASASTI